MVLPNKWEESEMILSGKNQHDSFIGWEEPKWFFQVMGRTKMVLPWNGKNQNGSSTGWEEPKWFFHRVGRTKMVLPSVGKTQNSCSLPLGRKDSSLENQDGSSYAGKNHNDSSIKNGTTQMVLLNNWEE